DASSRAGRGSGALGLGILKSPVGVSRRGFLWPPLPSPPVGEGGPRSGSDEGSKDLRGKARLSHGPKGDSPPGASAAAHGALDGEISVEAAARPSAGGPEVSSAICPRPLCPGLRLPAPSAHRGG